ncbi:lpg1689 family Dot/Icm T4SS effector [Legionella sp. WA2022007384]
MYGKPSFYKQKNIYTYESISDEIKNALKLLVNQDDQYKAFLEMLELRKEDFNKALKQTTDPYEIKRILEQYHRFAKTLSSCLSTPHNAAYIIDSYHKNKNYYPVGATKVIEEPFRHNISLAATILGSALILASIAAIWINPLITAILLPIGITMLAPGGASLLIPGPIDTSEIKSLEKLVFQAGVQVNNPQLSFDETQGYTPQYASIF